MDLRSLLSLAYDTNLFLIQALHNWTKNANRVSDISKAITTSVSAIDIARNWCARGIARMAA